MAFHNRDKKDFNAGILYIVLGGFFALFAQNYPMGTAVRMGPAYFPTFLGWMLAGLGLIIFVRSFFAHGEEPLPTHWRPLGLILVSVVAFGFLLNVAHGSQPAHYGVILLSALFGASVSGRQMLLNIVPGSGAYGSAILDLHFYTWAFLLFVGEIGTTPGTLAAPFLSFVVTAAIVVTAANAVTTFIECGPLECPDNPVSYWLLNALAR